MNRKRSLETEKLLRRADIKRKRVERVVSGYLCYMHPEIYAEALEYYNRLDAIHPNKKDLRKTPQFLALQHLTTHHKPVEKTKVQQVTEKILRDSFVLEIPLMKRKTAVRQTSTVTRATETSSFTRTTETATTTRAPEKATTITTVTSAPEKSTDITVLGESTSTSAPEKSTDITVLGESTSTNASGMTDLLPIDDVTLEQIIEELTSDTNLHQFFHDMDFGMDKI